MALSLGHLLQIHGNFFVKRSGEVTVGDRIRLQHRPRSIRGQRIPGGGVQNSGGGQVIGLLESSQGAPVVVAIHAVNFARREVGLDQGALRLSRSAKGLCRSCLSALTH